MFILNVYKVIHESIFNEVIYNTKTLTTHFLSKK